MKSQKSTKKLSTKLATRNANKKVAQLKPKPAKAEKKPELITSETQIVLDLVSMENESGQVMVALQTSALNGDKQTVLNQLPISKAGSSVAAIQEAKKNLKVILDVLESYKAPSEKAA